MHGHVNIIIYVSCLLHLLHIQLQEATTTSHYFDDYDYDYDSIQGKGNAYKLAQYIVTSLQTDYS